MAAALVFGLGVSAIYGQLKGRIEQNAVEKLNREMAALLGGNNEFEAIKNESGQTEYFRARDKDSQKVIGYAFAAVGGGFADKIRLLVAVDVSLQQLLGIAVLKSNETPGFGDKMKEDSFKGQFVKCPAPATGEKLTVAKTGNPDLADREIITITGATVTSEAAVKIVNDAVLKMKQKIKP